MNYSRRKNESTRPQRLRRSGAAAVEFAFAGAVLFFVIFGAIEFTRLMMLRNLAQDAAYEAARHTIVEGATEQEAIDKANAVVGMLGARGTKVVINDGDGIANDSPSVKVYIEIPMKQNAFIFPRLWGNDVDMYGDKVISAEVTLRAERYNGYFDGTGG
jgi:hypothetical protein